MALPFHAFAIKGGCRCGAVRYAIDVPNQSQRPQQVVTSMMPPQAPVYYPSVEIDHCSDCRRATGSMFVVWFISPIEYATFSLLVTRQAQGLAGPAATNTRTMLSIEDMTSPPTVTVEERRTTIRAADAVRSGGTVSNTHLAAYESSPGAFRSFCSRCGTNVAFSNPQDVGKVTTLDVLLGTVDPEDLEREGIKPARHVFWDSGIDWVKRSMKEGDGGLVRHPRGGVGEVVMED